MPLQPQVTQEILDEHRSMANTFIRKAHKYQVNDPVISRICSFYAAYHAMRYAILTDPLFDLPDADFDYQVSCSALASAMRLCKEDRMSDHHSGHRSSGRGIGQNQVVSAIYCHLWQAYESLHKTSVDARYVTQSQEILLDASDAYYEAQKIVFDALAGNIHWNMVP